VVIGLRVWYVSALYVAAILMLGMHMFHGVWSMFQSLGINHPAHNDLIRTTATYVTVLIVIGFASIPVGVLIGIIS
jgi:succinate dehydrogenase / fumarate reductase, cytochrome b subunit